MFAVENAPGEVRRSQNWIGSPDNRPETAAFVPPAVDDMQRAFDDRLQAVRERGELREWLVFFLTGVAELANDAVGRAERLVDLRESYRQRLSGDRSRAVEVIDLVFQIPVLTTTRIAETLDTTLQSALNHVRRLESASIVSEARGVPGRSKRWISTEVFHAVDPEASASFSNDDEALPDHAGTTSSR